MIPQLLEIKRDDYRISTDHSRLDLRWIHNFLANDAYWSRGIPVDVFEKSVANSLCFGLYDKDQQIGFSRVVSDFSTFAYLADVFVAPEYRQQGLGKWLVDSILNHPDLQGLRRWMLATSDAHELYRKYGFTPLEHPEKMMELLTMEN
ncbi:MAG: GNAT family N-acetyltransferase [Anaerolineales bacterium]